MVKKINDMETEMKKIYIGMPTDLYNNKDETYKELVEKKIPDSIVRIPSYYMNYLREEIKKSDLKGKDREKFLSNFFLDKVKMCDIFVYVNTYTKDGNILFPKGVREELAKALSLGKEIYRIYQEMDGGVSLVKTDLDYVKSIANSYNYDIDIKVENWVLKTVNDYNEFYNKNPEARDLIVKQFNSELGISIMVPHRNLLYYIDECNKKQEYNWGPRCKFHDDKNHAILLPNQELTKLCPFLDVSWIWTEYRSNHLLPFPESSDGLWDLFSRTRTLHKMMYIIRKDVDVEREGIAYVDENGRIPFKEGRPIKDFNKIVAVRPILDIDIRHDIKKTDAFFDKDIFSQYQKTIDLFLSIYQDFEFETGLGSEFNKLKLMFSGNGIYFDLGEHKFSDFEYEDVEGVHKCKNFIEFDTEWKSLRMTIQQFMDENGITKLQIEKGYGWSRYFKVAGAFHSTSERFSIPLNIDEALDYNWIKEVTEIKLGLQQNIFKEIVKRAGNRWK